MPFSETFTVWSFFLELSLHYRQVIMENTIRYDVKGDEKLKEDTKRKTVDFDDIMDEMNGMSRYQLFSVYAVTVQIFCAYSTTTLPFYLSATPNFRCDSSVYGNLTEKSNISDESYLALQTPMDVNMLNDSCYRPVFNKSSCEDEQNISCLSNRSPIGSVYCEKYEYDTNIYKSSITTEWDLVCNRTIFKTIANALLFFGFFVGSLFIGGVADRIGRRNMMLFLSIFTSVFGFSMGLAQNYATYATCFVLYSVGTVGQYIVPYTYVSEISDKKRRGNLLFIVSLLGVFGDITISLIAALTRHWRYIAIYCGVINLFYLPLHFLISESPRWLLSVGKEKQACEIVKRYYKSKNLPFKMDKWNEILTSIKNNQQKEKKRKTYSVLDLYKLPRVRIITLNVMFTWFVISLVYYGLVLNIGNLAGDPYVNGIVNSSLDIIATIFGLVAAKYVSKTYIISGSFISAGIACLGSMLVLQYGYPTVSMVLASVGRFAAASVYKIVYVLTPELFPTLLLGTGIGIGSGTSRIGGMLSPLIVQAQETYPWIMQTIFGILGIIAGFASLIYPDTKNVALPSTPEESEVFFQNNMAPLFKRRSKRIRGRLTRSHVDDVVL